MKRSTQIARQLQAKINKAQRRGESNYRPPRVEAPETLDDYLAVYAPALAQHAQAACQPLHVPGVDPLAPVDLLRPPYEAQANLITAASKALQRQKGIQVSGEQGCGKSLMMAAICQAHSHGRGYRGLIFCPPHLVGKWERELRLTLANVHVHHLQTYHDLTRVMPDAPAFGRGWWIVSSTRAKMGPKWQPSFLPRRRSAFLRCPACHGPIKKWNAKLQAYEPVPPDDLFKRKHVCDNRVERPDGTLRDCGCPLWQWNHEIDRWPIAAYIHKKLPGWFDYVVIDESHQAKSAQTAIGQAMGSLAAGCKRIIAGTGTVFGGYAWHIRPILYRIAPQTLIEEGLAWDNEMKFNERYGRLERKVTETRSTGQDNRQSKGSTTKTVKYVRPGVMHTLFGRHLIGNTIFLSLDEVAEALPPLEEQVREVPMDGQLQAAYQHVEHAITAELKLMLQRKDKRLLSKMLHTLLAYPDHPYGWREIGYYDWDEFGAEIWRHVVTPPNLDDGIRPKEQALIELVQQEVQQGRKCWVYCVMTDARDVVARLEKLLAATGLRVGVLRASVETGEREEWIANAAPRCDVLVSHPQLVETGLDFFQKHDDGRYAYNVPSIIGYSLGYSTFTMRQAMRRHWRIGQREPCRNFYLHYQDTMQSRALTLMGKKLVASTSIEGKFSSAGLAALAGDEGTLEVALAKSLVERLDDTDCGRVWGKLGSRPDSGEFELPPPKHVFG